MLTAIGTIIVVVPFLSFIASQNVSQSKKISAISEEVAIIKAVCQCRHENEDGGKK